MKWYDPLILSPVSKNVEEARLSNISSGLGTTIGMGLGAVSGYLASKRMRKHFPPPPDEEADEEGGGGLMAVGTGIGMGGALGNYIGDTIASYKIMKSRERRGLPAYDSVDATSGRRKRGLSGMSIGGRNVPLQSG